MASQRFASSLAILLFTPSLWAQGAQSVATSGSVAPNAATMEQGVVSAPQFGTRVPVPVGNRTQLVARRVAPRPSRKVERCWYGWQTLATDGAAIAAGVFFISPVESQIVGGAFGVAAVGTYVLGGPIVHATRGHLGKAAGSLALRIGVPLVLGGIGAACGGGGFGSIIGGIVGGIVGVVPAVFVDATILARETVVTKTAFEPAIIPTVSFDKNGGWAGMSGTF